MKLLVTIFFAIVLSADMNAQSGMSISDKIIENEKAFALAIQSRDTMQTKKYQHSSYFLAYTTKEKPIQILPRQAWLNLLKDYVTHSFVIDDIRVKVYGKIAVAMLMVRQQATVRGEDRSGHFVLTDVWLKKGKKWLIIERHSSVPGQPANMMSK